MGADKFVVPRVSIIGLHEPMRFNPTMALR